MTQTTSQTDRPYRGVSAERRRLERRQQLLAACLELVGRGGVAGVTVEAVCAEARLTKRYFYESYPDRDALLVATCDQMLLELGEHVRAEIARAQGTAARSRAAAESLVTMLTDDPRRGRLYAEASAHPGLRARRELAIDDFTRLMLEQIGPRVPDRPDELRTLAVRLVIAGTTDLVTSWLAGSLDTDRETLVAAILTVGRGVDRD